MLELVTRAATRASEVIDPHQPALNRRFERTLPAGGAEHCGEAFGLMHTRCLARSYCTVE
jgi:hypothetical protein